MQLSAFLTSSLLLLATGVQSRAVSIDGVAKPRDTLDPLTGATYPWGIPEPEPSSYPSGAPKPKPSSTYPEPEPSSYPSGAPKPKPSSTYPWGSSKPKPSSSYPGGTPEPETSSTTNQYFCCSTNPGQNPTLADVTANVNCPTIPVLNIVNFFNTCSTDNHQVVCSGSQSGESNNGLANLQCTVNAPIQLS